MDPSAFSEIYWGKLKVLVEDMISKSILFDDKAKYLIECWNKLKNEIDISEDDKKLLLLN